MLFRKTSPHFLCFFQIQLKCRHFLCFTVQLTFPTIPKLNWKHLKAVSLCPHCLVSRQLSGLKCCKKVNEILSSDSNICRAPGSKEKIYLTASSDPRSFHTVNASAKCGKISCDCLNNQAAALCSHVIAVAIKGDLVEQFSTWFNSSKEILDLHVVLNHGITARNAAKSSQRTQVRLHGKQNDRAIERIKNPVSPSAVASFSDSQRNIGGATTSRLPFIATQVLLNRYQDPFSVHFFLLQHLYCTVQYRSALAVIRCSLLSVG